MRRSTGRFLMTFTCTICAAIGLVCGQSIYNRCPRRHTTKPILPMLGIPIVEKPTVRRGIRCPATICLSASEGIVPPTVAAKPVCGITPIGNVVQRRCRIRGLAASCNDPKSRPG